MELTKQDAPSEDNIIAIILLIVIDLLTKWTSSKIIDRVYNLNNRVQNDNYQNLYS